ncbi:hypothetical protein SLE2022_319010 [Rubroshorea leprosula]
MFHNAQDIFLDSTMRPRGFDLTMIVACICGKLVLALNYPSIVETVVVKEDFGNTFSLKVKSIVEALEEVLKSSNMDDKESNVWE